MSDDTVPPFEWVSHIVRHWLECLHCELCELRVDGVPTKFVFWAFSEVPHSPGSMRQGFLFEHAGEPLSRYAVEFSATTGKPKGIARPVLFGTAIALPQPRRLRLSVLPVTGGVRW
jgi:hypothetical protein